MSCRELVELVTAYLDGALAPDVHERLEAHLRHCDACVTYIEQFRVALELVPAATAALELRPDRVALLRAFREFEPNR
jgi:anti-sigma factor RsiW